MKKLFLICTILAFSIPNTNAQVKTKKNPVKKDIKVTENLSNASASNASQKPLKVAEYDDISDFSNGYAEVKLNGKVGIIDHSGNEILPCKYDNKFGLKFVEGMAEIELNGKSGYASTDGKEIVPPVYDLATYFHNGCARVTIDEKWGVIDKTGKLIIPTMYDEINNTDNWDLISAKSGEKWGFVNAKGETVIPFIYSNACGYYHGLASVGSEESSTCNQVIDEKGNLVIPAGKYESISDFSNGYATVEINGKYGCVDTTGTLIIPVEYDFIGNKSEGMIAARKNKLCGFLDLKGNELCDFKYELAFDFKEEFAVVKLNGSYIYEFLDKNFKCMPTKEYNNCQSFSEGLAACRYLDKYEYIDSTGEDAVYQEYDEAGPFNSGLAKVRTKRDYFFIGKDGSISKTFKIRNKYIIPELAANLNDPDVQNTLKVSGRYFITYQKINNKVVPEKIFKGEAFSFEPLADRRVAYVGLGDSGLMKFTITKESDVKYILDGPYASATIELRKNESNVVKKYVELIYKEGDITIKAVEE